MKIWKLALAVLLAAGAVAAYLNFPNPLEQPAEAQANEAPQAPETEPAPAEPAAPAGEST